MTASSQEKVAREGLDATQLLNIVNHPPGPERALCALRTFTSSENYVEAARELDKGDVTKLVDGLDQVCHGCRDTSTRLTTAAKPGYRIG